MQSARTPLYFQKALEKEIGNIAKDMLFARPRKAGEKKELAHIKVFRQSLPIPRRKEPESLPDDCRGTIDYVDGEEEEPVLQCPWAVVKIDGGSIPSINGMQTVKAAVCFGIFNDSEDNNGHEEILNLIQRVYERFAKDPVLDCQYTCQGEMEWSLQEEDTYPYFFGAIALTFTFTGFRREFDY